MNSRFSVKRKHKFRVAVSVLSLLGASLAGLLATASGASAATTTCGFANPGSGTYAQTLCWFDLTGYNAGLATSAAGQPWTINLPSGYVLTFTLNVSGSAVKAASLPTFSAAFLGRGGYTGVAGDPALYQTASGNTTATESNITMKDPGGNVVTDYSLVGADAESTDNGETIGWTSAPGTLSSLQPLGNACSGGFTGVGTSSVLCTGSAAVGGIKTGAAILASPAPTTFTQTMHGTGLQAFGFGVLVAGVELNKTVVNGFTGDSFSVTATNGSGTVVGSGNTNGGTTASTGVVTLITSSSGEQFTLAEAATSGSLANYNGSWSCTRNGAADPTLPTGNAGASNTVTLGVGDLVACTITNTAKAVSLSLTKHAATPVDVNNDGLVDAGDTIAYTFDVTNTGNIEIDGIGVTDAKVGPVSCPQASLAPGASETCAAVSPYTVTAADVTAGAVTNTATASGTVNGTTGPSAISSPPSSTTTPTTAPAPSLTVAKSVLPTTVNAAGQTVTYSYLITNTGNVTITNAKVNELSFTGTGVTPVVSCPPGAASLAPGAHVTCTATYIATQADIDAGSVSNTADASGKDPANNTVTSPPSSTTFTAPPVPGLTLVKSAASSGGSGLHAGDVITYSFVVTNSGNVTITDVAIDEGTFSGTGTLSPINCPGGAASLAPGDQVTCTATYTVTQADVDSGNLSNSATTTGTPPAGVPGPITSPPSTVTVPQAPQPALTVVKSASPTTVSTAGQTVTYSFLITNSGNVTITDAAVDEGAFTGTGTLSPINCPGGAASLAPGAQVTCTATYTVTQADIDSGTLSNTATATGTPPAGVPGPITSPPSTVDVPVNSAPALTVVKSASPTTVAAPGQTITYSFLVTNTGNQTITDVTVDDGTFTGTGTLSPINCPPGVASMAPGAQVTCTATYVVTQADIDAGDLSNTATVTGTPPSGVPGPTTSPPSTVVVPTGPQPALTIKKSASPTTVTKAGQTITYSFLITNSGNVDITDAFVTDKGFTGSGALSAIHCPAGAGTMAPGAMVTCTATYNVTQHDIDTGSISNTATASGQDPAHGVITSPPSSAKVTSRATSKLGLVKTAHAVDVNHDGVIDAGDRIDWTLVATNLGQTTITHLTVSDPSAGPATCSTTTLAPGASVTCTVASHTITAADVTAGQVLNTAVASGKVNLTVPITSVPAHATVDVHATPGPGPGPGPVLPFTGFPLAIPLKGAAILLVLGGLLMFGATVRRRSV